MKVPSSGNSWTWLSIRDTLVLRQSWVTYRQLPFWKDSSLNVVVEVHSLEIVVLALDFGDLVVEQTPMSQFRYPVPLEQLRLAVVVDKTECVNTISADVPNVAWDTCSR